MKPRIWCYGDDINTDMLFAGKYTYTCSTAEEIRPHLLEDLDPHFSAEVKPGDLIVAGENFGCGSSREQPALGLVAVGLEAVIAKSFARIFYRAAINQGLLLIECAQAVEAVAAAADAEVRIEPKGGRIRVDGVELSFPSLPPEIFAIRQAGGLLPFVRAQLASRDANAPRKQPSQGEDPGPHSRPRGKR